MVTLYVFIPQTGRENNSKCDFFPLHHLIHNLLVPLASMKLQKLLSLTSFHPLGSYRLAWWGRGRGWGEKNWKRWSMQDVRVSEPITWGIMLSGVVSSPKWFELIGEKYLIDNDLLAEMLIKWKCFQHFHASRNARGPGKKPFIFMAATTLAFVMRSLLILAVTSARLMFLLTLSVAKVSMTKFYLWFYYFFGSGDH